MERMGGFGFACACALVLACSGRLVEDTAQSGSALSASLNLSVQAPQNGYPGTPLTIFQEVYGDTVTVHHDVTMVSTIVGSFDAFSVDTGGVPYDPEWSCSQDASVKGQVTITCHADDLQFKDLGSATLTPNVDGSTISVDTTATEGGVVFGTFHSDIPIATPSGADLGVFMPPGGNVSVGQTFDLPIYVFNDGPFDSTGGSVTLTLTGPGKFTNVGAFTPCAVSDTSASCPLSALGQFTSAMLDANVIGTAAGTVVVSATVTGNESDPALWNNSASSFITVFKQTIADLAVSLGATPNPAKFNKPLTYTAVVTNKGPDAASGASFSDFLPPDTTFVSVSTTQGSCGGGAYGYISCDLGPLAANASATVKIVVTPNEAGTLYDSASVYDPNYNDTDPDYSNNYTTISTTVQGPNQPVIVTSYDQKYRASFGEWVDCAHDFVEVSGTLHYSVHDTYNKSSGRAKYDAMNNPQDFKGAGIFSGTTYTMTGTYHSSYTFSSLQSSYDYEDVMHLVGKGPGDDLFMHVQNHVVFGSDGTPSVSVSKYSYTCK